MEQINVAMIPAVLAGIVKQLEAIDGWLTLKTEPVLNGTIGPQEDWIDIYELRRMIPGDPKIELVRSWLYFHGIPPLQVWPDYPLPPSGDRGLD